MAIQSFDKVTTTGRIAMYGGNVNVTGLGQLIRAGLIKNGEWYTITIEPMKTSKEE